jgi:hypothetical protein
MVCILHPMVGAYMIDESAPIKFSAKDDLPTPASPHTTTRIEGSESAEADVFITGIKDAGEVLHQQLHIDKIQ